MSPNNRIEEPRWAGTREVLVMSWPIILGSLSYTVMQFCDQWMVSKLGTNPLAAVGVAGVWSFTMSTMLLGIVGCVSTFVGQSVGRGQHRNCASYTWQGIYLSLAAGLLAVVLWPLSGPLFGLMGHGEALTELELVYFRIRLFGYVPMAWTMALASFFQAVNRPRVPMYVAMVATVLNVILNFFLIFGSVDLGIPPVAAFGRLWAVPRLELAGAAMATVLAQSLQMVLLQFVFLSRSTHAQYGTRTAWRYQHTRMRELVRTGLPNGATWFLDIVNWSIFTSVIVGRFGATPLAAHNVAISFMHICFMPAVAVNQGIAAIVGQWIGRQDIARAKARTYTALKITMAYMTIMGLIFAVFGADLIRAIFSQEPELIRLGHKLLILAALFQAFDAINIICMGALRGAGDTRYMMWLTLVMAYLLFLPLALFCAFVMNGGAFGAWIGATAYIILLSGLLFRRFHGERWREINIFASAEQAGGEAPAPGGGA